MNCDYRSCEPRTKAARCVRPDMLFALHPVDHLVRVHTHTRAVALKPRIAVAVAEALTVALKPPRSRLEAYDSSRMGACFCHSFLKKVKKESLQLLLYGVGFAGRRWSSRNPRIRVLQ